MKLNISLLLLALFCVWGSVAHTASVHKWVDDNGVTHYSDQAPNSGVYAAKHIEVSNIYVTSDNQDNYYSVTNQWARMREERLERKKLQLEKAALKQAQTAPVPQVVFLGEQEHQEHRYYSVNPYGHGYRQHNRFNKYTGKKHARHYVNGFGKSYRGSSCRLQRRGNSRFRNSGLTLSIR